MFSAGALKFGAMHSLCVNQAANVPQPMQMKCTAPSHDQSAGAKRVGREAAELGPAHLARGHGERAVSPLGNDVAVDLHAVGRIKERAVNPLALPHGLGEERAGAPNAAADPVLVAARCRRVSPTG